MESGIKRTQKDYMLAFKLAVVEQVEKGELAFKEAQHRYRSISVKCTCCTQ